MAARASRNRASCSSISDISRWPAARTERQGGCPLSRALRNSASSFELKPKRMALRTKTSLAIVSSE
jgi:hypothetical protein